MLIDTNTLESAPEEEADILIVGSGANGLILAADLVRSGRRVTVLEAGAETLQAASQRLFENAKWFGYPLQGLHVGRFRVLGGTTNFWGGQLMAPDASVFEHREWMGCSGWPIPMESIMPFYLRLYAMLGMTRNIAQDAEVWRQLQLPEPAKSAQLEVILSRWVPEPNFPRLFHQEITSNPKLSLYINAPVGAIEYDSSNRISGVQVRTGKTTLSFRAKSIVLANGTVEIVRLLKLPLADGRSAAWSENAHLGKQFTDHIDCIAGSVTLLDKRRFHECFDSIFLKGIKYFPKFRLRSETARARKDVGITALFMSNSSIQEHLTNFKIFARGLLRGKIDGRIFSYPERFWDILRVAVPMIIRYVRYRRLHNPADRGIQLHLSAEQIPISTSEILLDETRDELGMPLVRVNWNIDGSELRTMRAFAKDIRDYLETEGIARVTLDPRLEAEDPSFLDTITDANHQMGGARMSAGPSDGVVDTNGAVWGTSNLYVAGAATFPAGGPQNPTFLAMALTLRLADHLKATAP